MATISVHGASENDQPTGYPNTVEENVQLDTKAIDGLRGFAVMHIVLGHYFNLFGTRFPIRLMGGGSMGLFYIISGFVMVLGYGQKKLRPPTQCSETICGVSCDTVCCLACDTWCCPIKFSTRVSEGATVGEPICIQASNGTKVSIILPPNTSPGQFLTVQTAQTDGTAFETWSFLKKRIARLLPVYYLTNIVACVLATFHNAPIMDLAIRGIVGAFGMTSWISSVPPNAVTWTISTMFFFYLCFPAVALRLQRLSKLNLHWFALGMLACQAVLMLGVLFWPLFLGADFELYMPVRMFPPFRLPVFIMGCCCAYARICHEQQQQHTESDTASKKFLRCRCLHPVDAIFLGWLFLTGLSSVWAYHSVFGWLLSRSLLETFNPILFYVLITMLTMPGHEKSLIGRFFRWQPMRSLGDISMSVYMVHMLVVTAIVSVFGVGPDEDNDGGEGNQLQFWTIPVALTISLLLGWLITTFFEKPIAKLIRNDRHIDADKKLEKRMEEGSPAPSNVVLGTPEVEPIPCQETSEVHK